MDTFQALAARAHLKLLESRICSFREELKSALEESAEIQRNYENCSRRNNDLLKDCSLRRKELETDYDEQLQEYKKQIKISEEMLIKEKDKRQTLLEYLKSSKLFIKFSDDFKEFDWSVLEKMASNCEVAHNIEELKRKSSLLDEANKKANEKLNDLVELFNSTINMRNRVKSKLDELVLMSEEWRQMITMQEKKRNKIREENIKLNLLIKQCVTVNEPMSKHVTDNVRAKCQSFLNSSTTEELISGLKKYKERQDRIIKLLKHKEKKLSRDINLLQVATDRTADQMHYYQTIVGANENYV